MGVVDITDYSFLSTQDSVDVMDIKYYNIMKFYENHSQRNVYRFSEDCFREVEIANENFYNQYGLYFRNECVEDSADRKFMLIIPESVLSSPRDLDKHVQKMAALHNTLRFDCCIFDLDLSKKYLPNFEQLKYVITKRYPAVPFLNEFICRNTLRSADVQVDYEKLYQGYSLYNVSDLLMSYDDSREGNTNVSNFFDLCKKLLRIASTIENCVFTLDSSKNITEDAYNNYFKVAAYLTTNHHLRFIIPRPELMSSYLAYNRELLSRDRNLLEDYLLQLNEFPYFSVSLLNDTPALFIKNVKELVSRYDYYALKLTVQAIELDLNTLTFKGEVGSPVIVSYDEIKIKPLAKMFALNAVSPKQSKLEDLNTLLLHFAKRYKHKFGVHTLHQCDKSTMLCFEQNGKTYFGYVVDVQGSVPFIVQPLMPSVPPFTITKQIGSLEGLYDIALIHDLDPIINSFCLEHPEYGDTSMWHFKYSNSRGIASLFNVGREQIHVTAESGLTIAEAGLWNNNCNVFRDLMSSLGEVVDEEKLMERKVMTYFGCIHPYYQFNETSNKIDINISVDLWR